MERKKNWIVVKLTALLFLLMICVNLLPQISLRAKAATVIHEGTCGDNITYTIDDEGKMTISGTGAMDDYDSWSENPWWIWNYPYSFTSVEIQEGITHIGDYAFADTATAEVSFPSTLKSIGSHAFWGTDLKTVSIPSGVTEIGSSAFYSCDDLESVNLSSGIKTISSHLFAHCTSLTSIKIPSGVTSIDEGAFFYCTSLTSIKIPSSVTSIGKEAFDCCKSLTEIEIPSGVSVINIRSFQHSGITEIEIPSSVTTLYIDAFDDCDSLKKLTILGKKTKIANSVSLSDDCTIYGYPGSYIEEWAEKYGYKFVSLKKTAVKKITISGKTSVKAGKKITLKATVKPSNATNKTVTWSSSNKKYATVTSKGVVTAKAAGAGKTVKITAKATDGSGVKATYKVTIKAVATKSIKVSPTSCTLTVGNTKKLSVTVNPSNSTQGVTYQSLNKKIAKVSSTGKITAVKAGKTTIVVQSGLSRKTVSVTVKAKKQETATSSANKKNTYDGAAAASYANANAKKLYAGGDGEKCAGFVAKCLINGAGLSLTYQSRVGKLATSLVSAGFTKYILTNTKTSLYAKGTTANSMISVGDVIIYYCTSCSAHWQHAALVTKIDSSTKKVYITDVNINNSYRINCGTAADYKDSGKHGWNSGKLVYYLYHYEG